MKVIVVTGGGNGIGKAIARTFAQVDYQVVIAERDLEAGAQAVAEIDSDGGRAEFVEVDVTDLESVTALADHVYQKFGRVDVLCNNAGVALRPARTVWEASAADYQWLMGINFHGVINGLTAFVPRMRAQSGHKAIVNTASNVTFESVPGLGPYAASKAAVEAVSLSLDAELRQLGEDFSVTILSPGKVHTAIGQAENARPTIDQSAHRALTPVPEPPRPWNDPIESELVGPAVLDAVRTRKLYCLTHPLPVEALDTHRRTLAYCAPQSSSLET